MDDRRIAVTRPAEEAAALAALLAASGARVAAWPLIHIEPPADPAPLAAAAGGLDRFDWVVVTSANAAEALARARGARPWPREVQVAAVGEATARALAGLGVTVALVPARASGAALAAALAAELGDGISGRRVLFPRSDIARRELARGLRDAGARVEEVEAYRTRPDRERARALADELRARRLDGLVVTSPSNAEALAGGAGGDWPALLAGVTVVAIGPTTAARLAALGRPADAEAARPDPEGIAAALRAAFGRSQKAADIRNDALDVTEWT